MFESFVIGPVTGANGLIRQCVECRAASADPSFKCSGFGPGCIAATGRSSLGKIPAAAVHYWQFTSQATPV